MRSLRHALMHCFVWLTAAATLLAGTPHVQCRCPRGTLKPARLASVGMESCCCCSQPGEAEPGKAAPDEAAPGEADDAPPSCCRQKTDRKPAADGASYGHDGCQRTLVEPSPATSERADVPMERASVTAMANVVCLDAVVVSQPAADTKSKSPVLPSLDLHLVLQHFVI